MGSAARGGVGSVGTAAGYRSRRPRPGRYPAAVPWTPTDPEVTVRRARIGDVRAIKALVDHYSGQVLLAKQLVTLYEDVQEFWVAHRSGALLGCGALHVLWEDLGEIRTLAVHESARGHGVGHVLVDRLVGQARELGLRRVFVLTFEQQFFERHGFVQIDGTPVSTEVYDEMRRSHDEGVAEFLDLPYVKPNTLGNSRMLLEL
ncbi:MAG: amino-acid N-acetyltransferase [Pseudonocardiaceae bacterium]|nr:amino-acid N-acetyltransferase [Pseudonocardiaceae bacterium]